MMGAFINNDCSNEALDLYDKIEGFNAKIQRDNIYAIIWRLKRVERFGKGQDCTAQKREYSKLFD